eukprot:3230270-Rhodomonas_salina.1
MRQIDHVRIPIGCFSGVCRTCCSTHPSMVLPVAGEQDDRRAGEVYQGHAPSDGGREFDPVVLRMLFFKFHETKN